MSRPASLLFLLMCLSAALPALAQTPAPTAEQCIAHHTEGQSRRLEGRLTAAAQSLRSCLHPECSPLLRAACATLLDAVEAETPTLVLAAQSSEHKDLVEVSVHRGDQLIASRLNGRALALDPGPHLLRFSAPGMQPLEQLVVVHAGQKNRLFTAVLQAEPGPGPAQIAPLPAVVTATAAPVAPAPHAKRASVVRPDTGPRSRWLRLDRWDYALLGTSLSALVAGTAVGVVAFKGERDARERCYPNCSRKVTRPLRRQALSADGLFIASAGVFVVAAIRVLTHKPVKEPRTTVLISPSFVGAEVPF